MVAFSGRSLCFCSRQKTLKRSNIEYQSEMPKINNELTFLPEIMYIYHNFQRKLSEFVFSFRPQESLLTSLSSFFDE